MWYDRRLFRLLLVTPHFPRAFMFYLMVAHFLASGMEAARHAVEVQLFRFAKDDLCLSKRFALQDSLMFFNGFLLEPPRAPRSGTGRVRRPPAPLWGPGKVR